MVDEEADKETDDVAKEVVVKGCKDKGCRICLSSRSPRLRDSHLYIYIEDFRYLIQSQSCQIRFVSRNCHAIAN